MTTWTHTSSASDTSNSNWISSFLNVVNSYSLDFDNSDAISSEVERPFI